MNDNTPYFGSPARRSVLLIVAAVSAAIGGVGSLLVAKTTLIGGLTLADAAYLLSAAGGVLIVTASLFAPTAPGKVPYVPVAMGFLVIALALGHMADRYSGVLHETLLMGMAVAIGLEFGLFLAWGMQQRAETSR
jgi:hypothetical protein